MDPQLTELIVRLKTLICDCFEDREEDFAELMLVSAEFDYSGKAKGKIFPERALSTVRWFKGEYGIAGVLRLAKLVAEKKPGRPDAQVLIAEIKAVVELPAEPNRLSPMLAAALGMAEEDLSSTADFIEDLRAALRDEAPDLDVPGRFHLDGSEAKRLAAILALEAAPDLGYLRWLAERVTVEPPEAGFMATQALLTTAVKVALADLPKVQAAVKRAKGLLDLATDDPDVPTTFGVAVRKRELEVVDQLIASRLRRPGPGLNRQAYDGFLAALLDAYTADGLRALCERLKCPLARPNDPSEHIVISLVVTARSANWERDLVAAVAADHPTIEAFAKAGALFPAAVAAGPN
jgi:hypothetical protein